MTTTNATRFRLVPSRLLALIIGLAHVGAATALLTVAHRTASGWALAALLVALGIATAWDRALLRASGSVRGFVLEAPDSIVLELASNDLLRARVGARRWVSAHLVVLSIDAPRRRTLLVTGAMLDPADFRRLRLWALWGQVPGVAWKPRQPRGAP